MTTTAYSFGENATFDPFTDAGSKTDHMEYGISMSGSFGGGTLTIERWDATLSDWVFVASATEQSGIRLAVGIRTKFRAVLSGSTTPALDFSFWPI
jgi:hypothetical protein